MNARTRHVCPPLTFGYYTYWADLPLQGMEGATFPSERRFIIAVPTNDDLSMVLIQAGIADFPAFRANVAASYARTIELIPSLAERMRAARQAERIRGSADLLNFVRAAHGPGWALVGDAGFCRDPLPARGIRDAFADAERLAEAVDSGLAGRSSLEEALAGFERARDAVVIPAFAATCRGARFPARPPELRELVVELRRDQGLADRYAGVAFGTVSPDEFSRVLSEPLRRLFEATGG